MFNITKWIVSVSVWCVPVVGYEIAIVFANNNEEIICDVSDVVGAPVFGLCFEFDKGAFLYFKKV
ncbi:hypothetical protein D3C84_1097170 [compost metagenome]